MTLEIFAKKSAAFVLAGVLMIGLPVLVHAQNSTLIPPCGNKVGGVGDSTECTIADLIKFVGDIITFLIFNIAIPLAVLAFVWIGIKLIVVQGQGKAKAFQEAKDHLWNIVKGMFFIFSAYAIVSYLYSFFTDEYQIFFRS